MKAFLMITLVVVALATPVALAKDDSPKPPKPASPPKKRASETTASPTPTIKAQKRPPPNMQAEPSMRAAIVPSNSFAPPFDEYDEATGERMVKTEWIAGGHTDVHENFVRLTNDRQAKAGYLHNVEPIAMLDFSVYINFRISGAGQRLFGDGIAIWFTDLTESSWRQGGDFFAGPLDFKGFVVVLDTFKNAEMGSSHKDVMLYVNDGTEDLDLSEPEAGATANYRYYEGRDDFSVLDYSALHIMYKASTKTLLVMLDEKNTGEFKTVIEHKIDNMPRGWDNELRMSFSAATGSLADNHDLLSVKLIKAGGRLPRSAEEEEVNPREIQSLERQVQKQSGGAQIAKLMKLYRRDSEMRLNHLHHAIEHELSFIQDSLESAIKKIRAAEADDHQRIEELERKAEEVAKKMLTQHLDDAVERTVSGKVDSIEKQARRAEETIQNLAQANTQAQERMKGEMQEMIESKAGGGGGAGWITILLLIGVFGGILFLLSRRVARMEKNHLP